MEVFECVFRLGCGLYFDDVPVGVIRPCVVV